MMKPAMIEVSSGITSTGISPRAQVGTLQLAIQWAISTGEHAADDGAEEAGGREGGCRRPRSR